MPFNSFAEYAPEPNPETKKKIRLVRAVTMSAVRLRGHLDRVQGRPGTKSNPFPGRTWSTASYNLA